MTSSNNRNSNGEAELVQLPSVIESIKRRSEEAIEDQAVTLVVVVARASKSTCSAHQYRYPNVAVCWYADIALSSVDVVMAVYHQTNRAFHLII